MIKHKNNLIFIEKALSYPEVVRLVTGATERIWHKITNETAFEHECYVDIGKAILEKEIRTVGGLATRIVRRKEAKFAKRGTTEPTLSIESLAGLDDEVEDKPYEIEDVLADVEREVLGEIKHKEIVTNLAEGDDLKREILNAWTEGYNDTEISRVLANSFGGKSTVHRITIQRFKKACKKRMGDSLVVALAS